MRIRSLYACTVCALFIAGCAPDPPAESRSREGGRSTRPPQRTGVDQFYLNLPNDTAGCHFRAGARHPDAMQLIEQYMYRVAQNQIERNDAWLANAAFCPGRYRMEGAAARVIRDYRITVTERSDDHVRVTVAYDIAGRMFITNVSPDSFYFRQENASGSHLLDAVRTPTGWRLINPDTMRHVTLLAAERFPQPERSRTLLQQAPRTRPVRPSF